jgi:hypothetical protein
VLLTARVKALLALMANRRVGSVLLGNVSGPKCSMVIDARAAAAYARPSCLMHHAVVLYLQVIEFTSEKDQPTCAVYHPASETYIACGYSSGYLRIFDVTTATAVLESRSHTAPVVAARYLQPAAGATSASSTAATTAVVLLATASLDGTVLIHDASEGGSYLPVKKISFGCVDTIFLEVSDDSAYLAVAAGKIGSVTVFETRDFTAQLRLASSAPSGSNIAAAGGAGSASTVPGASADFPTATMQSITYMANSTAVNPAPPSLIAEELADPSATAAAGPPATPAATQTATPSAGTHTVHTTVSPDRRNTASSAANISTSTIQSASSALHANLVGLTFVPNSWGWELLLATDKHLISVNLAPTAGSAVIAGHSPTPGSSANPSSAVRSAGNKRNPPTAWDERLTKRIDCGVPTYMTRDPTSGLLFLALRTPLSANPGATGSSAGSSGTATSGTAAGRRASMTAAVGTADYHAPSASAPFKSLADAAAADIVHSASVTPAGAAHTSVGGARKSGTVAILPSR